MAVCAKEMHKPVYVVAESFKFTRIFPLNQDDVPREFKVTMAACFWCCLDIRYWESHHHQLTSHHQ